MIKPRIVQVSPGFWECACDLVSQTGSTLKQAYDRWLGASLIDAMENLQQVNADMDNPISPEPKPKPKAGKPITIKAAPKPVTQPKLPPVKYHQSIVQAVPGTVATREYRPPTGLLINQLRAEQAEPKLSPLASDIRFERRVEL